MGSDASSEEDGRVKMDGSPGDRGPHIDELMLAVEIFVVRRGEGAGGGGYWNGNGGETGAAVISIWLEGMCSVFFLKPMTDARVLNLIAELDLERPPGLSSEDVGVGVAVFAWWRVDMSVVIFGGRWEMVDAFAVGTLDHHCFGE